MSQIRTIVSTLLLLGSVVGCGAAHGATAGDASGDGRLDLVIRPENAAASSRPLEGNFSVRSLERGTLEPIALDSTYETRSVRLHAGSYLLEWQPRLPTELNEAALQASAALASSNLISQRLVVAAGQVTKLNVTASAGSSGSGEITTVASLTPASRASR